MAAERFFTKIAQDVLNATERLANHIDDNFNQLLNGGNDSTAAHRSTTAGSDYESGTENDFDILNDDNNDDGMMDDTSSPLQGMADQVLSGIMEGQVGSDDSFNL